MRGDTSTLLQLKQSYPTLFHTNLCRTKGKILQVQGSVLAGRPSMYAPYARFEPGVQAAVVVSNPNDLPLRIKLSLGRLLVAMGFADVTKFVVQDVFQGGATKTVSAADLDSYEVTVGADRTKHGGMSILLLQPRAIL